MVDRGFSKWQFLVLLASMVDRGFSKWQFLGLLASMVDQVLLTHWAHRIKARGNPQDEDIIIFLNAMEEIINDVPPSYRQL